VTAQNSDIKRTFIAGEFADGVQYKFAPYTIGKTFVAGTVNIVPGISPSKIEVSEFISISDADWDSGTVQVQLTDGEKTCGQIQLIDNGSTRHIRLLSAPVYFTVTQIINGNVTTAVKEINQYYPEATGWEFRGDCRDTLRFEIYVDVLDTLVETESTDQFEYVQFRSAVSYFAKRILDTPPQSIRSINQLKSKVEYWNNTDNLKHVKVPEVIGEKLGRRWYRDGLSTEREELRRIGFVPEEYDPEWETVVPACWIAHTVLTDGVETAKDYVRRRPVPRNGDYSEIKSRASNADYGDRGPAWGAVISRSATMKNGEFRKDAYWYLRLTGRDYRGKGKFKPLLAAGAAAIAPANIEPYKIQKVEFEEQYATGHVWRRDNVLEKEADAFREAKRIAQGMTDNTYETIPWLVVKAESNLADAEAKLADREGDEDQFIKRYEDGISEVLELAQNHNLETGTIEGYLDFLQEKRSQAKERLEKEFSNSTKVENVIEEISGIGKRVKTELINEGFETVGDIRSTTHNDLTRVSHIGPDRAAKLKRYINPNSDNISSETKTDSKSSYFADSDPVDQLHEDIPGVGQANCGKFFDAGYETVRDLRSATQEELTNVPQIGPWTVERIQEYISEESIEKLDEHTLPGETAIEELIDDIPRFNRVLCIKLEDRGFETVDDIRSATYKELTQADHIGKKRAEKLKEYVDQDVVLDQ
jgi:ERCC4-type nuclease